MRITFFYKKEDILQTSSAIAPRMYSRVSRTGNLNISKNSSSSGDGDKGFCYVRRSVQLSHLSCLSQQFVFHHLTSQKYSISHESNLPKNRFFVQEKLKIFTLRKENGKQIRFLTPTGLQFCSSLQRDSKRIVFGVGTYKRSIHNVLAVNPHKGIYGF